MNSLFQKFYRGFYLRTGGYLPSKPINQNLYLGDFFQIRNGEMIVLGNIFRRSVVSLDSCELSKDIKLNPSSWDFSEGVTKPYSGREATGLEIENNLEFSKQILGFKEAGSYMFKGNDPESIKIANWQDIRQELIIKLTQTYFSFRELYLVTESVTTENWTLAIASDENAELEIATRDENFGLVDIFGLPHVKAIQTKHIGFYDRHEGRSPVFFKAKKLVVQQEKLDVFVSELNSERANHDAWAKDFFEYDFFRSSAAHASKYNENVETSILDMLQANQLNPNTALQYFHWGDMNLDDVQRLFITYGND